MYYSSKVDIITEFKKVYLKDDYPAFCAKQIALREFFTQELWKLIVITD